MARADWLVKLRISCAIYLRATREKMASGLHPWQAKKSSKLIVCGVYYLTLLYGSVSQGLGTTKFTNLIGWNGYWPRSRFSHLDRECFEAKKLQAKIQNYWLLSSNNIYFHKSQTADEKKKVKRTSKLSSPFATKMTVSTNQLLETS